ncbi:hypothetical protein WJ967_16020 [Achromobacter xylosoxidans]
MLAVEIARGVLEQDRPAPPAVVHDENEFPQRHVVGDMAIGGGTVVPGHVGRQVGVEGGDLAAGGVLFAGGLMVRVPGLVRVLEQARCARAGVGGARRGAERRFDVGNVRRDLDGRGLKPRCRPWSTMAALTSVWDRLNAMQMLLRDGAAGVPMENPRRGRYGHGACWDEDRGAPWRMV